MSCLFCSIMDKTVAGNTVYEDEHVVVLDDIYPQAPIHKLIIPRKHIATINDLSAEDTMLIGHMVQTAREIAKNLNIADNGYRLVFNVNKGAGQAVFHIHLHLMAGRNFNWPPG